MAGRTDAGEMASVRISPEGTEALNYGFDVTPARLVSGLITERGVVAATAAALAKAFPERLAL
jgi:methylthioribose-1-phosphate isomerase